MPDDPIVFVVDDDEAMRHSLQRLLEASQLRVATYDRAAAFLAAYDPQQPGCLLLDVCMPEMSGLDLQKELARRNIHIPIIIITAHGDVPGAVQALRAGAMDFIQKPFQGQIILKRIRAAIESDRQWREERGAHDEIAGRLEQLTPREREVMELVVAGRSNKQIAFELDVSRKTIEIHRAQVMRKTQADSLAELVRMAVLTQKENAS